jgi:hypothetical protein
MACHEKEDLTCHSEGSEESLVNHLNRVTAGDSSLPSE